MSIHEIETLSQRITIEELKTLIEKAIEYNEKWYSIQPGLFFIVQGGWGDLFKHEIISVDAPNRKMIVKDYSLGGQESEINYIPDELLTEVEFNEKYI